MSNQSQEEMDDLLEEAGLREEAERLIQRSKDELELIIEHAVNTPVETLEAIMQLMVMFTDHPEGHDTVSRLLAVATFRLAGRL